MKLNIGCGPIYKKGFINIDAYNDIVADKLMYAWDLDFKDNSVDEILASHIIEHLGFIRSIYAISEWLRVLKPNGRLFIETPNIEKLFDKYLKSNEKRRREILTQIYGLEVKGLAHKFCFSPMLLEEILRDNGFVNIKREFKDEVVRISCYKSKKRKYHLLAKFRKKLYKNNLIDFDDQRIAMEQERLIKFLFSNRLCPLSLWAISKGAIYDPAITIEFVKILSEENLVSQRTGSRYLQILETLKKNNFPSILCALFRQIKGFEGEHRKLYHIVSEIGRKSVEKMLKKDAVPDFKKIKIEEYDQTKFFSENILIFKSDAFFQKGIKNFLLGKYEEAIKFLKLSIRFYRDQFLGYWNLGRLYKLLGKRKMASIYYKQAIKTAKKLSIRNNLVVNLKKELYGEPIHEPVITIK